MTYAEILLKKFCFIESQVGEDFSNLIWNLNFPDTGITPGEVRYKIKNVEDKIKQIIIEHLIKLPVEAEIKRDLKNFSFDINKMGKGEWIPWHNEISQKSPFEVILWLTKSDHFEGRYFQMKGPEFENKRQPTNGLVCFLDTTTPNIYHGVSPLISNTNIISITGGLGRKEQYAH